MQWTTVKQKNDGKATPWRAIVELSKLPGRKLTMTACDGAEACVARRTVRLDTWSRGPMLFAEARAFLRRAEAKTRRVKVTLVVQAQLHSFTALRLGILRLVAHRSRSNTVASLRTVPSTMARELEMLEECELTPRRFARTAADRRDSPRRLQRGSQSESRTRRQRRLRGTLRSDLYIPHLRRGREDLRL